MRAGGVGRHVRYSLVTCQCIIEMGPLLNLGLHNSDPLKPRRATDGNFEIVLFLLPETSKVKLSQDSFEIAWFERFILAKLFEWINGVQLGVILGLSVIIHKDRGSNEICITSEALIHMGIDVLACFL